MFATRYSLSTIKRLKVLYGLQANNTIPQLRPSLPFYVNPLSADFLLSHLYTFSGFLLISLDGFVPRDVRGLRPVMQFSILRLSSPIGEGHWNRWIGLSANWGGYGEPVISSSVYSSATGRYTVRCECERPRAVKWKGMWFLFDLNPVSQCDSLSI